jgi:ABC-type multidrug transport system fused ATPase/permease subunit
MKDVWALFRKGLTLLSSSGRRTLYTYGGSLFLLAILDGVALYFISKVFSTSGADSSSVDISSGGSTLILVVILFALRTTLSTVASWYALHRLAHEETAIGHRNFTTLMNQPWSQRIQGSVSDLYNGVDRGPGSLVQAYLVNVVSIAAEASSAIVILGALLLLQPATALIASVYFVVVALIQHRLLSRRSSRAGEVVVDKTNLVYETLADSYALGKLLAINPSRTLDGFLNEHRDGLSTARARVVFLSLVPRYFMELILAVGLAVIAGATYAISDAKGAISAVTIFAAAGFRLLPIVNRIQALVLQLFSSLPVSKLAFVEQAEPQSGPSRSTTSDNEAVLELDHVSFAYPNSPHKALSDVNLVFQHGKQYAVIGPSGAGKTTLIDVCLGLLTPSEGSIRIRPASKLGYVPQDTHVARLDLSANIAIEWSADAVETAGVNNARRQANLDSILDGRVATERLSDSSLSGGQKQRIGLARALYRSPDVLFLDEVTSALDAETEHSVMKSIMDLKGKATVIIVAHRLSTVQHADCVIYVDDGKIQGVGTFDELRRTLPSLQRQIELGTLTFDS